ncbi:Gar1/Naf1 RNA binding region-domain-containing protein [Aspergillus desertorum]
MTESHHQHNPGSGPEGPPTKRFDTNDTPPIALTPADDGSDFYNTPLLAGTPMNTEQKPEDKLEFLATETTVFSDPPPQIPGLSLVNDSLSQNRANQNSGAKENSLDPMIPTGETEMEIRSTAVHNGRETKDEAADNAEKPAVVGTDAMEVGEEHKQPQAESEVNKEQGESTNLMGNAEVTENAAAETAPPAQAEQHEEDEEEEEEEEEEHPEWEMDSSPYESSSDSSTDSSDDSDEDEDYPILSPEEQARILMQGELGSDDEGEGKGKSGAPLKTANEIPEEVLPIPDVTITPEMKIVLLGSVHAAVDNIVLIAANTTGEYQVLEAGSLLCLEDRRIAGVVSETLGRVENPLYALRFPTAADVEERGLSRGTVVYYVVDHSTFVFTQPLKGLKGSDASNFHDEEVAEDEVEFSDDEQEAEYRRKLKQKRQERKGVKNQDSNPSKAARGPPGPSKLSHSELNYDDNAPEDGYTPLARPKNLHEMMQQGSSVENVGFSNRNPGFGGRGHGRGSDRGRGSHGRGRGGRDHGHHSHHNRQPYHQQEKSDAQPQPKPQQHQPQPYPAFSSSQQYPSYPSLTQQPQHQQLYAQAAMPTASFNFQLPYQQAYQQPNPYQQMSPTPHINPLFLAALQQQQQQQQYQQAQVQALAQQQPGTGQPQPQNQAMNFDQVKAQLDLLRHLSDGQNQWPPRS